MHELLSATSADRYVEAMRETVDRLAGRLRDTPQPFSGASREQLQELVDAVDLDADGLGTRSALREADELVGEHAVWFHHPATRPTSTARWRCRPSSPRRSSRP